MPPLVGVAVKVTLEPAHDVCEPEVIAILTLATTIGFTVIIIALLVAGEPVEHGLALEVSTTVTESPFANVDDVKVELLVPAFTPFTCH